MRPHPTYIPDSVEELRVGFTQLAEDYARAYLELLVLRRLAFGQKSERVLP